MLIRFREYHTICESLKCDFIIKNICDTPSAVQFTSMRVALLGAGRGSNAEAILRAKQKGQLGRADIVGIFCDNPHAPILKLGPRFSVPAFYLAPGPFKTKFSPEQERVWANTLLLNKVDLVVLAGFMRVIKAPLLDAFKNKIINIHPSLLPSFPGLDGIGQTWRAGVNEGGCTVHWVTAEVDGGLHLGQTKVSRENSDTLETFTDKIHAAEHILLPKVIAELSVL
jgi:phosphoribosylglycinamide formyltransferase-1